MSRVPGFIAAMSAALLGSAQVPAGTLLFVPWWNEHVLQLGGPEIMPDGSEVRIDRFRFYVGIPVASGDAPSGPSLYNYHLIDAADTSTWQVACPRSADHFLLGVDSLTSVSGVFAGDLDPTQGMYWAWNSGYINLKLEGTCSSSPYPKKEFELHLGGYASPNGTAQHIKLDLPPDVAMEVIIDVRSFLTHVDLGKRCNVMSPGPEAVRLSKAAANTFSIHAKH